MKNTRLHRSALLASALPAVLILLGAQTWRMRQQEIRNQTLIRAVEKSDAPAVLVALNAGADPNARKVITYPLQSPADVWRWLRRPHSLSWYAPILAQLGKNGGANDAIIMEALIRAGADVNARDATGRTALMNAALDNRPNLITILLAHGAKVNLVEQYGTTALREAQNYMREEKAGKEAERRLRQAGASD